MLSLTNSDILPSVTFVQLRFVDDTTDAKILDARIELHVIVVALILLLVILLISKLLNVDGVLVKKLPTLPENAVLNKLLNNVPKLLIVAFVINKLEYEFLNTILSFTNDDILDIVALLINKLE